VPEDPVGRRRGATGSPGAASVSRTTAVATDPAAARIRVLIAKPGLDGHDRGAKIIARSLRDAGMEVIYTGLHRTPAEIVATAVQEDAQVVGVSILSGAHMALVPRILELLRAEGADDVLLLVGGTIPPEDADALKAMGVDEVYGPGTPVRSMVEFIRASVDGRSARAR
jgi:methylmalonyl-CoA mutase C-terminal domain/subunit